MGSWIIYGKRTGKTGKDGQPKFDKRFAALDYSGMRVTSLEKAGTYATKEDALEKIHRPLNQELVDKGLVVYDIRPAR